jgi:citrate lyase subunit beta/citryl-CoA lyase
VDFLEGTVGRRAIAPTRSQLYVPADRPDRFAKGEASGVDALILDLEDAVDPEQKAAARDAVVAYLAQRDDSELGLPTVLTRVNALGGPFFLDDLIAVTGAGVAGILVPKISTPTEVAAVDLVLKSIEAKLGMPVGGTLICPLLETPSGIRDARRIGEASGRVAYMGGISARGGDIEGSVGFRWSSGGRETAHFRAGVLLDARAAGVVNPVTGVWTDIEDLDGLHAFALENRNLGYEGMAVIHPRHVAVVNDVFTPSAEELDRDLRVLEAMEQAAREGVASIRFEGEMVDIAMAKRARARLERFAPGAAERRIRKEHDDD